MNEWVSDIRVVSFDLDDTLWDCPPVIEKAERRLLDWFSQNAPEVLSEYGKDSVMKRRAQVVELHPEIAGDMTRLRHKIIEVMMVDAGYPASDADIAHDLFYRARSEVVLYENTESVLEALGKRYQLAVITNGNADLTLIGLAERFAHIQRADTNNPPKPAPDMFNQCLTAFDIQAGELAHIGDNPVADVQGGQGVGARTVWYRQPHEDWPSGQARADAEVTSLKELQTLFISEPS